MSHMIKVISSESKGEMTPLIVGQLCQSCMVSLTESPRLYGSMDHTVMIAVLLSYRHISA